MAVARRCPSSPKVFSSLAPQPRRLALQKSMAPFLTRRRGRSRPAAEGRPSLWRARERVGILRRPAGSSRFVDSNGGAAPCPSNYSNHFPVLVLKLGAWKSLGISGRQRAPLRKEVLLAGEDWTYDPHCGEMRTKRNVVRT
ncbi:hypothetical protein ZWY2020_028948 [Hordeum vulgare]|nr:hypothetical protein ZWY2020_028948 [Hordeum vulgare]